MMIDSPVLPYNFADLEPVISRDTLVFHSLRHQRVCYDRLQSLIRATDLGRAAAGGADTPHREQAGTA